MKTKIDTSPKLLLSDVRGIYIPRDFVTGFKILIDGEIPESSMLDGVTNLYTLASGGTGWQGISIDDVLTCIDPDQEWYWDSWERILNNAHWTDENGIKWTLYQDGDLWAVAYDNMTTKGRNEFFGMNEPEDEDEENS